MGRSPCHPCPACGVTLPVCAPVPLRLLGHFPGKDSPATPALGKFIPLMLFAALSGNLFAASEPESLAPDSSVGSHSAQDTARSAASERGGKALYLQAGTHCERGPWNAYICPDAIPSKAGAAGTLWHLAPQKSRVWQSRLPAGHWVTASSLHDLSVLGHGQGWAFNRRLLLLKKKWQKCHLPPQTHAGPSPHTPCIKIGMDPVPWGTSSIPAEGHGRRARPL